MKKKIPMAMTAAAIFVGSAYAAHGAIMETMPGDGDVHLIYAPSTGNLTVSVNGNAYGVVQITSTTKVFTAPYSGTSPEYYESDTGFDFGFGVLTGTQTADVVLPGVLLPSLSESTLLSSITVNTDSQGVAPTKFSFSGGLAAVPEPASLGLLSLGGLAAIKRRNKA